MQLLGGVHNICLTPALEGRSTQLEQSVLGSPLTSLYFDPFDFFAFEDTGPGQGLEVILSVPKTPASCLGPGLVTWAGSGT